MKRFYVAVGQTVIFCGLSFPALAQPEGEKIKMKLEAERLMAQVKTMNVRGMVMGPAVKGAPYSAVEIFESTQVLGDGTRIHNERQMTIYRDSEGRIRRETPDEVTIIDPVAGTSYAFNTKDSTAKKLRSTGTWSYSSTGPEGEAGWKLFTVQTSGRPAAHVAGGAVAVANSELHDVVIRKKVAADAGESLGKRTIEGVIADGTRRQETIEVGAIGNDRAIHIVDESWYSPELRTVVQSRRSDPRTGEETFRLTNIVRTEPPAYLFQPPADMKAPEKK